MVDLHRIWVDGYTDSSKDRTREFFNQTVILLGNIYSEDLAKVLW